MSAHDPAAPALTTDALREPATAPRLNETVRTQLSHRTIRTFTEEPLDADTLETLLQVAHRSPTSAFQQQVTIIRAVNPDVREQIFDACGYPNGREIHGELFVFVLDLHRNAVIRERAGVNLEPLERTNLFLEGAQDTMIAAQNVAVAAQSLGLGVRYLGAVLGDPQLMIDALNLPERTFPLVGMLVGHPAEDPQFKPRLPRAITQGVDTYPHIEDHDEELAAFDREVEQYYDLRDTNRRVDAFTTQIASRLGVAKYANSPVRDVLTAQKLALR